MTTTENMMTKKKTTASRIDLVMEIMPHNNTSLIQDSPAPNSFIRQKYNMLF